MSYQVRLGRGIMTVSVLALLGSAFTWFTGNHREAVSTASVALLFMATGSGVLATASRREKPDRL